MHFLLFYEAGEDYVERRAQFRDAHLQKGWEAARRGELLLEVEGECRGAITRAPRGTNGFGYDPVFFFPELGKTYAELGEEEKNRVSHRARAVAALRPALADLCARRRGDAVRVAGRS